MSVMLSAAKRTAIPQDVYENCINEKIAILSKLPGDELALRKYQKMLCYAYDDKFDVLKNIINRVNESPNYMNSIMDCIDTLLEVLGQLYKDDVLLQGEFRSICNLCNGLHDNMLGQSFDEDKVEEYYDLLSKYLNKGIVSCSEYPRILIDSIDCLIELYKIPILPKPRLEWWYERRLEGRMRMKKHSQ